MADVTAHDPEPEDAETRAMTAHHVTEGDRIHDEVRPDASDEDDGPTEDELAAERKREIHLTMDLCLRIGELLLASGAGAADVTATMQAVAQHLGLRHADVDVTFTALSMNWQPSVDEVPTLMVRHVRQRDIDYQDLTAVDHLVRDVLADRADLYLARSRMATIVSVGHSTPRWGVTLAFGVMCAAIGVFLGGGLWVSSVAFVAAVTIDRVQLLMARRRLPFFYLQVAGGAIATLIAVAVAATPLPVETSLVVTANIIMLLAGIGLMGAVQDALTGFYITAGARLIEAMMATAGIIAGVTLGLSVGEVAGVTLPRLVPGSTRLLDGLAPLVAGAAVAAAAFAVACYAPWRSVVPIALVTAAAAGISTFVDFNGFGRAMAAGAAALFVGVVAYSVAGRIRVPPLVVAVPAIVPLLPGLSIYRGLSLLSEAGTGPEVTSRGILALITALSVAIALASGVILGEYIAQPVKKEARRLERRLSGPRLVGPYRALSRAERRARTR